MSSLIVEVCTIDNIEPHPNADRLRIATIKGWNIVFANYCNYVEGQKIIYIPPDSILPEYLSDFMDVTKYCKAGYPKNPDGTRDPGARVSVAKLRGRASYGMIMKLPTIHEDWEVGTDVAKYYGITKWEPSVSIFHGDTEPEHSLFARYTDIENYKNFPDAIPPDHHVVITEKIHGTNCRLGAIRCEEDDCSDPEPNEYQMVAGSHNTQREPGDEDNLSMYWQPYTENIHALMKDLLEEWGAKVVIVFGEIYGPGVQDMAYGQKEKAFRVFDIMIDGNYINGDTMRIACLRHDVHTVVVLYSGPLKDADLDYLTTGTTTMCDPKDAGKFKGREGIVIKPEIEQHSDILGGRMILKNISPDYLVRKGGTEDH